MQKLVMIFVFLMAASFVISQDSGAATAIATLIEDFFVNRSIRFDFINYRCPQVELIDKVSMLAKTPAKIRYLNFSYSNIVINQSAILLFNDSDRYYEFYRKSSVTSEYPKKLYLFAYIRYLKLDDLLQFYCNVHDTTNICAHVYFLLDRNSSIDLVTTTTFQQPECR
jgi:hypothetical protein